MPNHNQLAPSEIHAPYSFNFADSTDRLNYVATIDDLYKLALQTDNASIWMLASFSPVIWQSIPKSGDSAPPNGAAGGGLSGLYPNPTVIDDGHSHTPGSSIPAYPTTLPPNGAAGGDLSGTYPNPTLSVIPTVTPGVYYKATVEVDDKGRIINVSANSDSVLPGTFVGVDLTGGSTVSDTPTYGDDSLLIPNTQWVTRGSSILPVLASTESFTISSGYQKTVYGSYTVEGSLTVAGTLIIENDSPVDPTIESRINNSTLEIPFNHFKVVVGPYINNGTLIVNGTLRII